MAGLAKQRVRLAGTDVEVSYDRNTRTITLFGALMGFFDDPDDPTAWMVVQHPEEQMRIVLNPREPE